MYPLYMQVRFCGKYLQFFTIHISDAFCVVITVSNNHFISTCFCALFTERLHHFFHNFLLLMLTNHLKSFTHKEEIQ